MVRYVMNEKYFALKELIPIKEYSIIEWEKYILICKKVVIPFASYIFFSYDGSY